MSTLSLLFSAVLVTGHSLVNVSHYVKRHHVIESLRNNVESIKSVSKVSKVYQISRDKMERACKRTKYQACYYTDRLSSSSISSGSSSTSSRTILVPASAKVSIIKNIFFLWFFISICPICFFWMNEGGKTLFFLSFFFLSSILFFCHWY